MSRKKSDKSKIETTETTEKSPVQKMIETLYVSIIDVTMIDRVFSILNYLNHTVNNDKREHRFLARLFQIIEIYHVNENNPLDYVTEKIYVFIAKNNRIFPVTESAIYSHKLILTENKTLYKSTKKLVDVFYKKHNVLNIPLLDFPTE